MADVTAERIGALRDKLTRVEGYLHIEERRVEIAEMEAKSAEPGFWDDAETARAHMAKLAANKQDVEGVDSARSKLEDAEAAFQLASEMDDVQATVVPRVQLHAIALAEGRALARRRDERRVIPVHLAEDLGVDPAEHVPGDSLHGG